MQRRIRKYALGYACRKKSGLREPGSSTSRVIKGWGVRVLGYLNPVPPPRVCLLRSLAVLAGYLRCYLGILEPAYFRGLGWDPAGATFLI